MASRPDLTEFNVAPSVGRAPVVRAPQVQNFAPQQIDALGRAVQQVGGAAADVHLERLREANALVVNDAVTRAKELELGLTYGDNGYTRQKGWNAIQREGDRSLADEYGESYGKGLDEIYSGLKNDAQRQAFTRFRQQSEAQLRERATVHTDNEYNNWAKSNVSGSIALLQDEVALGYDDPARTRDAIENIKGHAAQLHGLEGLSAPAVEAMQKRYVGQAVAKAVEAMIDDGKVWSAEEYLNRHRNDMDADSIARASQLLDGEAGFQLSMEAAQDAVNGATEASIGNAPEEFISPVQGMKLTSSFGERADPFTGAKASHKGLDVAVPMHTPVSASASGTAVVKSNPDGYGTYVEIDHGGGWTTRYAHLDSAERKVGETWEVRQGEIIGRSGSSGRSTGPHLHYEVRKNGQPVDPAQPHRTDGRGARGPVSPAQTKEEARQRVMNDPRLQGNRQRRQAALAEIDRLFATRDYDERKAKEDAQDAAWRWRVENPGASIASLPASVRNTLDGATLLAVQKSQLEALKTPNVDPMLSALTAVDLQSQIADGTIRRPEQLFAHADKLNPADLKTLGTALAAVRKGEAGALDAVTSTKNAMSIMDTELRAAGFDPKKKGAHLEEYNTLKARLYRDIEEFEAHQRRKATGAEKRNIVLGLIGEVTLKEGGFLGIGGDTRRGYEVEYDDIPADVRGYITEQLVRQGVPRNAVRKADVLNYYLQRSQ